LYLFGTKKQGQEARRGEARKYVDEVLSNMQEENLVYPE